MSRTANASSAGARPRPRCDIKSWLSNRRNTSIDIEDYYLLSPLSLYRKYRVFPTGVVLHVLLVLLALYHTFAFNAVHGVTKRVIGQNFHAALFPDDYAQYNGDSTDNPTMNRYFIFDLNSAVEARALLLQRYWALPLLATVPIEVAPQLGDAAFSTSIAGPHLGDTAAVVPLTCTYRRYAGSLPSLLNESARPPLDILKTRRCWSLPQTRTRCRPPQRRATSLPATSSRAWSP